VNQERFDNLTRALATKRISRWQLLKGLVAGAVVAGPFAGRARPAEADFFECGPRMLARCIERVKKTYALDSLLCKLTQTNPQDRRECEVNAKNRKLRGLEECRTQKHCSGCDACNEVLEICETTCRECQTCQGSTCVEKLCGSCETCQANNCVPIPGGQLCGEACCGSCQKCEGGQCRNCNACETCENGTCTPIDCGDPCLECRNGACFPKDCGDCETCQDGACVPKTCTGPCETCQDGACTTSCSACEGCVAENDPVGGVTFRCAPVQCPTPLVLNAETCECECPPENLCGGTCVDSQTDPHNCGSCGNVCGFQAVCQGGTCVCPEGLASCPDGSCVDCAGLMCAPNSSGGRACCGPTEICNGVCCHPGSGERYCCPNGCSNSYDPDTCRIIR
jgi:hypothetical protein